MYEVYSDKIYDLQEKNPKVTLKVRENGDRGVHIENLTYVVVWNESDAFEVIEEGLLNHQILDASMGRTTIRSTIMCSFFIQSSVGETYQDMKYSGLLQ